jgi:hypothetical protein
VTLMLQAELRGAPEFEKWYSIERNQMKSDDLLRRFVDGRNFVVHQGMLQQFSSVQAGLFRGRTCKLSFGLNLSVEAPSRELLAHVVNANDGLSFQRITHGSASR